MTHPQGAAPVVALTGTPGAGKTTVAAALEARGWTVVDLTALADAAGLLTERDAARDTRLVDVDAVDAALAARLPGLRGDAPVVLDAHWSHCLAAAEATCVLRCHPATLEARLLARGWSRGKARENAEAEALGVIAHEARDAPGAFEVDTTGADAAATADAVARGLQDPAEAGEPGALDWTRLAPGWF